MKIERPQFELARVYADGTSEVPEIIRVSQMPWDTKMERRGFLGVGVGVASVLLSGCDKQDKQYDGVLKAHAGSVQSLAISPDGKTLASGSGDSTIKLWLLPEGTPFTTLDKHGGDIYALAISPDGKTLVSGSLDQTIKLWSLPEGKLLATLEGHKNRVNTLAISPDGKTLSSGSNDYTIKLWSLPKGKLLVTLEGHKESVFALAISSDGKTLASGFGDGAIKLWSLPNGKLLAVLEGHKGGGVRALAISPDGKTLASGSFDQTIKLWSLPEGKLLATLEGHKDSVFALAINPKGKTLASGSFDRTIKLWSLPEGKLLATLEGHKISVLALAISPDGKILASGDLGGRVILSDIEKHSSLVALFDPNTPTPTPYHPPDPSAPSSSGGRSYSYCTCNKVCTCIPISDRNVKEAFETTDPLLILQRLSELPIQTWNYKWNDAAIRHIGPMAQDFAAAFAVGEDDKHICPVDAQGVAFAAIQGLYRIVREKDAQTASLQAQLQHQQAENQELKARVEALERLLRPSTDNGAAPVNSMDHLEASERCEDEI